MPRSKEEDRLYQRRIYRENCHDPEFRASRRARQDKHNEMKRQILYDSKQPCIICGESEPSCIDFHHVRGEKKFTLASYRQRSVKQIKEEIDKCVCLCANCHRKVHAGIITL